MEKRLTELEPEEEAGLLKRPPATGGKDERRMRNRDVVRHEKRNVVRD